MVVQYDVKHLKQNIYAALNAVERGDLVVITRKGVDFELRKVDDYGEDDFIPGHSLGFHNSLCKHKILINLCKECNG